MVMEYGYINEDGYLRSDNLEQIITKYKDEETGEINEKIISIEEQLEQMGNMWKPVDKIDESLLVSDTPEYSIHIVPYDNGDRISFRYEKAFNNSYIRKLIEKLEADDYKIIKCYESFLVGEEPPYDIKGLHEMRQSIRNEINRLQIKQLSLKGDENI